MRSRRFTGVAFLLVIAGLAFAATQAGETTTLRGSYDWKDGGSDDLSADFEPDGDDRWMVTFRFRWNDRDHTWSGTAEGSLEDGSKLTGTATSGNRNWVFEAGIEDGVMRGTHTEIQKSGKEYNTGSFELKR